MIGSPFIGAWVAQVGFWILVALGIARGALRMTSAGILVALWLAGYVGLPRIAWWTGPLVTSYVAILDIILVFVVFKGDVRLTS
jgi:hypothetical protein